MKIYETLDNGIKIVEYEESLATTLADMWNKSADDWGGDNEVKTPSQVIARNAGAAMYNVYVAMDGEVAVGYCSLGRYFADAEALYIDLLGVRPDYKGKKIGKALVLQCVNRTIELKYPRLDIHTWGGNTDAVPLYKKCGYLWEDRPDSTHLVNFIPTILKTELFFDFFDKSCWYTDSTRDLEIKPDGVKVNEFEVFGYSWEKDGETLAVGFERTGRQMRLIETNDYKIEFMAQDHKLAFGLNYGCTFKIENKTGRDLHVKINGLEDKNIKFDFTLDEKIEGAREFNGTFYVGEVTEPQSKWKVHPCVLANVEINGSPVVFGLGINPKFPLTVDIVEQSTIQHINMDTEVFVNIRSSLLQDAKVKFNLPQNNLTDFEESSLTAEIPAGGKTYKLVKTRHKAMGYEALQVTFEITMQDGKTFSFTKPIHLRNQDLTHAFSYKTDTHYGIINGPWRLNFDPEDNEAHIYHLVNNGYTGDWYAFNPPKLGKPYDDEFNLLKPAVKMYQQGMDMVAEVEFVSEKFAGLVITQIYTLNASGITTRRNRVENRGTTPREVWVNDGCLFELHQNTIFRYKGEFTQNHSTPYADGFHSGMDSIDPDGLEENWAFEDNKHNPMGFCWHPSLKPNFQWGGFATFEIDAGTLAPGDIFETEPVVYAYGIFSNFMDFRNYAMKLWGQKTTIPVRRVEPCLNGFNPFVSKNEILLEVLNNREVVLEGEISVSSVGSEIFAAQSQTNPPSDEPLDNNKFTLELKNPSEIEFIRVSTNLTTYEKSYNKILFVPKGEIAREQNGTNLAVSNGAITFQADPVYGHVCYSMKTTDGAEWLFNQYPEHKPFAWWQLLLGGIRLFPLSPHRMTNGSLLKEQITADFAEIIDNHGNKWEGIRTTLTIKEFEELRGVVFETYFVTLPGLPILCTVYKFFNGTGEYRTNDKLNIDTFLNPSDDFTDIHAEFTNKHQQKSHLHLGTSEIEMEFENLVKLRGKRPQSLYLFSPGQNSDVYNCIESDNKFGASTNAITKITTAPGETYTSNPMFLLVTEKEIPVGALDDLERLVF